MLGLLTHAALLALAQHGIFDTVKLAPPIPGAPPALVYEYTEKVATTKIAPKKIDGRELEFEWLAVALGVLPDGNAAARFDVYSQQSIKGTGSKPTMVATMLSRLWEYNVARLKLDHSEEYNVGLVDVYLCWGGTAGGEQIFDVDPQNQHKVNTIYLYDLNSFTDPVEMAREVAHEYGHASLPAVGGFKSPEDWANGYLGEKLFLRWVRDCMKEGKLAPADAMGASPAALDAWVKTNVDPLVENAAKHGPDDDLLAKPGKAAMDSYIGLALYTGSVLSEDILARAMKLIGSTQAKDFPAAIVLAAEEPDQVTIHIPPGMAGQAVWVPLGTNHLFGAKILAHHGAWAKVQPGNGAVVMTPTHAGP